MYYLFLVIGSVLGGGLLYLSALAIVNLTDAAVGNNEIESVKRSIEHWEKEGDGEEIRSYESLLARLERNQKIKYVFWFALVGWVVFGLGGYFS